MYPFSFIRNIIPTFQCDVSFDCLFSRDEASKPITCTILAGSLCIVDILHNVVK